MDTEFLSMDFLSEEELNSLIDTEPEKKPEDPKQQEEVTEDPEDKEDPIEDPESVGNEETKEPEKNTSPNEDGSPDYSSIAKAFQEAGVLRTLTDDEIKSITDIEALAKAMDTESVNRQDEQSKRVLEALKYNVEPSIIQSLENTLTQLNDITTDFIEDESDQKAINFRQNVIFQDYLNKGYSKERALKMVQRSFKEGNDIDDAKDSLESCKEFYQSKYKEEIANAKANKEKVDNEIKETAKNIEKSINEDKKFFESLGVSETVRKKIVQNATKQIKDKDGKPTTAINKYAKENPIDFYKYFSLFYTLTDGFTNIDSLIAEPVNKKNKQNIKAIEDALRSNPIAVEGNPKLSSGVSPDNITLDWKDGNFTLGPM